MEEEEEEKEVMEEEEEEEEEEVMEEEEEEGEEEGGGEETTQNSSSDEKKEEIPEPSTSNDGSSIKLYCPNDRWDFLGKLLAISDLLNKTFTQGSTTSHQGITLRNRCRSFIQKG
ncbi:hypothetical protein I79_015759 [Cricetulus griseus]|uniref:Uncharacterized protein n=1 Tax=Cricetulus griseus TaxID=10029 RepID=G3HXN1_CRIGR|nr:hypothetical protein I79_015759 [Cricetulus griseus]